MRLPLTPPLDTRDGVSAKNARLTNCLKEVKKSGEKAVVRPGLVTSDTYTGIGNGLIPFDGRLLLIYDDTVYDEDLSVPWPFDAFEWSAATNYGWGDVTWYLGNMWFSWGTGSGNTPGSSSLWKRSYDDGYIADRAYEVGETTIVNGVTYYSLAPSNTGNPPASSPYKWSTTPTTSARWRGTFSGSVGGVCGSIEAAGYSAWEAYPYRSCATKSPATTYSTFVGMVGVTIRGNQWSDPTPNNCTAPQNNLGIANLGTVVSYP